MTLIASPGQLRASFVRWTLVCVPLIVLLGALSGKLAQSGPENSWFASLNKPAAFPPTVTFGIVWTVLFVMMGIALAIVLSARGARWRGPAVAAFAVQFLLNLSWSPVFFAWHQIKVALGLIVVLDVALIVTIALFWRVRPKAAMLLAPYLAWVLFATYLTFAFLQANPHADEAIGSGAVERFAI